MDSQTDMHDQIKSAVDSDQEYIILTEIKKPSARVQENIAYLSNIKEKL